MLVVSVGERGSNQSVKLTSARMDILNLHLNFLCRGADGDGLPVCDILQGVEKEVSAQVLSIISK